MTWLANYCFLAFGWRRFLLLLVAGALGATSMPPLFFLPALFIALPVWVWCLDGAEIAHGLGRIFGPAFGMGFAFGLGYFLVSLHWIGGAFFVDGGWLILVMPFAVLGLAALLALFWGFASALAHLFWSHGASRILALALSVSAFEFARGHILTGFPFDLPGYALTANTQMMQLASVIGVYGLTLVVLVLAGTPALIWPADDRALTRRLAPFFLSLCVLAAQLGWGQHRLDDNQIAMRDDLKLRLVQPGIPQAEKWLESNAEFTLSRLLELSQAVGGGDNAGLDEITHVIWPESALPFYLSQHPEALARIARMLPEGTMLITGMPRLDSSEPDHADAYNSVLAINADGEIVQSYDKTHLVPFGEYLPLSGLWEQFGLKQMVAGNQGWTAGDARRLLDPEGMPAFLPLVCYEIVFSGDLGPTQKAAFLLNLTNDAWFDHTIGPAQHFAHARLRAVEEGRPLVRVANTGISAVVDPFGRITAQLDQDKIGILDVKVPQIGPETLFSKFRYWPLLIAECAGFFLLIIIRFFGRRSRRLG